jgi:predicted nucleotidyltransferase
MVECRAMANNLRIPANDLNLLKTLQRYGIPFVIIGGHAIRFHGVDRETEDLDVLVDSAGRAKELRDAVNEVLGGDLPPHPVALFGKPYKQIPMKRDGMNSDILTGSYGVEFAEVYQAAHVVEVDGLTLRFISKERLIRNKRAAGRDKDLLDVERLESDATL